MIVNKGRNFISGIKSYKKEKLDSKFYKIKFDKSNLCDGVRPKMNRRISYQSLCMYFFLILLFVSIGD